MTLLCVFGWTRLQADCCGETVGTTLIVKKLLSTLPSGTETFIATRGNSAPAKRTNRFPAAALISVVGDGEVTVAALLSQKPGGGFDDNLNFARARHA